MSRVRAPKKRVERPGDDDLPGCSTSSWPNQQLREWRELVEWASKALKPRKRNMATTLQAPKKPVCKVKKPKKSYENEIMEQEESATAPASKKKKKLKLTNGKSKDDDAEDDSKRSVPTVVLKKGVVQRLASYASGTMSAIMREMQPNYAGQHLMGAGELRYTTTGIPIPFALEWLFQSTVLPLGRMIQIVGKTGSNKSSLAVELVRLLRLYEGVGYMFENESKFNAELALSILGYTRRSIDEVLGVIPCIDLNDWQTKLQDVRRRLTARMMTPNKKTNPKPLGAIYPVAFIVDSVMGKLSKESNDNINSKGHADRKHPDEAMKITYFLKKFASDIADFPFMLILVNHLKIKKIEGTNATERVKTGGELIGFQESTEIECKKIGDLSRVNFNKNTSVDAGGNRLEVKCAKNSMGQTNRKLEIDFNWEDRIVDGEVRQFSFFDWPGACVDILLSYQTKRRGVVRDIVDVRQIGDKQRFCSSALGVKEKEPVSKTELGKMITANKEIRRELRKILGIKRYNTFKPGMDFHKMIKGLRSEYQTQEDKE